MIALVADSTFDIPTRSVEWKICRCRFTEGEDWLSLMMLATCLSWLPNELFGKTVVSVWGTIAALCRIGFACLALGDAVAAAGNLRDALERAHASEAISLELLALSGIGAVLAETSRGEQAATMLIFTLGHEQLPSAYGFAARPALEALEAKLPPEQLAAARLAAAATSLEDLITQALLPTA